MSPYSLCVLHAIAYLLGGINPDDLKWLDSWLMKILIPKLYEAFFLLVILHCLNHCLSTNDRTNHNSSDFVQLVWHYTNVGRLQ